MTRLVYNQTKCLTITIKGRFIEIMSYECFQEIEFRSILASENEMNVTLITWMFFSVIPLCEKNDKNFLHQGIVSVPKKMKIEGALIL